MFTFPCSLFGMQSKDVIQKSLTELLIDDTKLFIFSYSIQQALFTAWSGNAEEILGLTDKDLSSSSDAIFNNIYYFDRIRVFKSLKKFINSHQKSILDLSSTHLEFNFRWYRHTQLRLLHCRATLNTLDNLPYIEGFILDASNLFEQGQQTILLSNILKEQNISEKLMFQEVLTSQNQACLILDLNNNIQQCFIPKELADFNFGDNNFDHNKIYQGGAFLEAFSSQAKRNQFETLLTHSSPVRSNTKIFEQRIEINGKSFIFSITLSHRRQKIIQIIDLSPYIRPEIELMEQHKSQEIRLLAAGVAHNINNALQAILGYTTVIQSAIKSNPNLAQEATNAIQESINDLSKVTKQLMLKEAVTREIDLNGLVLSLVQEQFNLNQNENLKLILSFGSTTKILADYENLSSALKAILTNAREATLKGSITISTECTDLKTDQIPNLSAGAYALIKVIDTGKGMDPAQLSHCLAPFYSTKNIDARTGIGLNGEGLGLTQAFTIIHNLAGTIHITSEKAKGTTVSIYLPINRETAFTNT